MAHLVHTADAARLSENGTRTRVMHRTFRLLGPAVVVVVVGCTLKVDVPSVSPATTAAILGECHPTVAHMTPPNEVFEFFVSGSSAPNAREVARTLNWFGNDAMWVILPPNGETPPGRLGDKIPPYRIKHGQVQWEAHRLDGPAPVATGRIGGEAYGDIGFAAGGVGFPSVGCWEVTYTLDGHDPLRFVLKVT